MSNTKLTMTNIVEYPDNIKRLSGKTSIQEGDLGIGGMYASSRIGTRGKQEDAVIIMTHPQNSRFKIMVVADGMGGEQNGEVASNMAIEMIMEWFSKLELDYYDREDKLQDEFVDVIDQINHTIVQTPNVRGNYLCRGYNGEK